MDDDTDSPAPRPRPIRDLPPRLAKLKAPARATRSTAAYFTSSANTQSSFESAESDPSDQSDHHTSTRNLRPRRPVKRKLSASPASSSPSTEESASSPTPTKSAKRRRLELARSKNAVDGILLDDARSSPSWALPYHIWLRVFDFVAAPIRDPASRIDDLADAVATLVSGARTCRSTAEPALAALYKCPPFRRPYTNHPHSTFVRFLQTLALSPSNTIIRYRPKVEILRIDVDVLFARKVSGVQLQLTQLIKNLPRLTCLELYHPSDDPPYRDLGVHLRWKFSKDDLFDGLEPPPGGDVSVGEKTTTTALKSWRWNSRLAPAEFSLSHLQEIHALPGFRSLRKLAFVNYQLPSMTLSARARDSQEARNGDIQAIEQLAASISSLPDLRHLVIESSTLANGLLLERLPKTLTHLELINCWEITSEDLSTFLMSHGNSLVYLTLNHCQSLSLAFLPVLGTSCPNLAHLAMDLSYFRHHEYYADNKPEYATLLEVDQVPTWPSSIQSIEIIHMRNWSEAAAEMFFGSLMKNAKALPNLRRLEFKVMLNIGWRQRQEMRKSLADQMTRVFKRKWCPPKDLETLRQCNNAQSEGENDTDTAKPAMRRSMRIIDQAPKPVPSKDGAASSSRHILGQALPARRSRRSLKLVSSTFDADDEESSEDELSRGHVNIRRSKSRTTTARAVGLREQEFIHGLCDVVDIQVDNKRPSERQFGEDDFLDSPEESDPEYVA